MEYDNSSEVIGRYPLATVRSAGQVSPVFEKKARELFNEYLDDLDDERWYETGRVVEAYQSLSDAVGESTMRQGGKESAKAVEWPPEVTEPMDGLGALAQMHKEAFRNSDREFPAGRYTFESLGERRAHVGVTEDYPFTVPHAEGVFIGVVQDLTNAGNPTTAERTPKSEEQAAFEIEW
jgi:hypothetical protein